MDDATLKDWRGSVWRPGKNNWSCSPSDDGMPNRPMRVGAVWEKWAPAWVNKTPLETGETGIAHMLMGDDGTSNAGPYLAKPASEHENVLERPNLTMLVSDE